MNNPHLFWKIPSKTWFSSYSYFSWSWSIPFFSRSLPWHHPESPASAFRVRDRPSCDLCCEVVVSQTQCITSVHTMYVHIPCYKKPEITRNRSVLELFFYHHHHHHRHRHRHHRHHRHHHPSLEAKADSSGKVAVESAFRRETVVFKAWSNPVPNRLSPEICHTGCPFFQDLTQPGLFPKISTAQPFFVWWETQNGDGLPYDFWWMDQKGEIGCIPCWIWEVRELHSNRPPDRWFLKLVRFSDANLLNVEIKDSPEPMVEFSKNQWEAPKSSKISTVIQAK